MRQFSWHSSPFSFFFFKLWLFFLFYICLFSISYVYYWSQHLLNVLGIPMGYLPVSFSNPKEWTLLGKYELCSFKCGLDMIKWIGYWIRVSCLLKLSKWYSKLPWETWSVFCWYTMIEAFFKLEEVSVFKKRNFITYFGIYFQALFNSVQTLAS